MHRTHRVLVLMMLCAPGWASAQFSFDQVIEKAQQLAASPYKKPAAIPKFMQELDYQAYQRIRFDPDKTLWRESRSNFQIMLVPPGLYYKHAVVINEIDLEGVRPINFDKSVFVFGDDDVKRRVPANLGYAGFKLTYPLRDKQQGNQFLVFAGASYFRGVGTDNGFGISARGIAVNTGLASGEKFPSFIEYWLERPTPSAHAMKFFALLDGQHLTGAYQFIVHPGKQTRIEVSARLFPRDAIELLGVAPLTSMFFYGQHTSRPVGEWRPQVHDSNGLLIHNSTGDEWLWRPLINPRGLEMDYFQIQKLQGFGLLQRDIRFDDFQDLEARYDLRPSAWVEPKGEWGPGEVVLTQLPSPSETNDNIVAFWHPKRPAGDTAPLDMDYTLRLGQPDVVKHDRGQVINTFVGLGDRIGGGDQPGSYRFIIDFAGGKLDKLKPGAPVVADLSAQDRGEILEHFVEYNQALGCWRLSVLARPAQARHLALRALLRRGDDVVSELWTYRLPANNNLLPRAD